MEARQLFSNLHHYIKDYQGNVGIVVRQDGAEVESNEYYPYGGLFSAPTSGAPATETLSAGYNKEALETVIANFKEGSYFNYPNNANSLYSNYKLGSTPTSESLLKKYLLKKK